MLYLRRIEKKRVKHAAVIAFDATAWGMGSMTAC